MKRREISQDAAADTKTVDAKTTTQKHVQRDERSQRLETHTSNIPGATAENEANASRDALRGAPVFGRLAIEMDLLSEGRIRVGSDAPEGQSVIDHIAHNAFLLHGPRDQAHAMLDKILDNSTGAYLTGILRLIPGPTAPSTPATAATPRAPRLSTAIPSSRRQRKRSSLVTESPSPAAALRLAAEADGLSTSYLSYDNTDDDFRPGQRAPSTKHDVYDIESDSESSPSSPLRRRRRRSRSPSLGN